MHSLEGLCKHGPTARWRVYEIKGGSSGKVSPKIFEATGENAATQSDDGVGSAHRPAHSRLLEPRADDGAAARFDDTRAHEELSFRGTRRNASAKHCSRSSAVA